jgi:hypothetical protein
MTWVPLPPVPRRPPLCQTAESTGVDVSSDSDDAPTDLDGLFIGGLTDAEKAHFLEKHAITSMLTVCFWRPVIPWVESRRVFPRGSVSDPDAMKRYFGYFQDSHRWVQDERTASDAGHILIHSDEGRSRAPIVLMAHIMQQYDWTAIHAFQYVRQYRSDILMPPEF